ncbi:MAG: hypothetical protein IT462_02495 [Planctomycetes bacterium]|nr:hypothetical protein [Planctomycetota bacterium]
MSHALHIRRPDTGLVSLCIAGATVTMIVVFVMAHASYLAAKGNLHGSAAWYARWSWLGLILPATLFATTYLIARDYPNARGVRMANGTVHIVAAWAWAANYILGMFAT